MGLFVGVVLLSVLVQRGTNLLRMHSLKQFLDTLKTCMKNVKGVQNKENETRKRGREERETERETERERERERERESLLVGCLTSQQHTSVSQGRICSDKFTGCHIEIEVADRTFHLTQSQYTDTRPASPSIDPLMPGTWQGSFWNANF